MFAQNHKLKLNELAKVRSKPRGPTFWVNVTYPPLSGAIHVPYPKVSSCWCNQCKIPINKTLINAPPNEFLAGPPKTPPPYLKPRQVGGWRG